jgi:sulfate permease, SulP family
MSAWWVPPTLRGYRTSWLAADALAGLTLVAVAVPSQMATAHLASLPSTAGLYAFIAGSLLYALLGPNRHLSVGADSTIAPVLATGVASLAALGTARYAAGMALAALLVGALLLAVGLLRMGWIAEFLSTPVITGILAGIAVEIIVRQLPIVLGLRAGGTTTISRLRSVADQIGHTNGWTVAVALCVLAVIVVAQRIDHRLPGALLALVLSIVAVDVLGLASHHGVAVLGAVHGGLPHVRLPPVTWSELRALIGTVLTVAFVCIAQTAATVRASAAAATVAAAATAPTTARSTATTRVPRATPAAAAAPVPSLMRDFNRDLIGVGAGSVAAGLIGALAVDASPPNTAITTASGGRSQLTNILAALIVLAVVLLLTAPLAHLPEATLGATLVFIAAKLFRVGELRTIWRFARIEFALAVATLVVVAVVGIEQGVVLAIALSLADRTRRAVRPRDAVLGREPGTDHWIPCDIDRRTEQVPGVLVYLVYAPLWYGNADYLRWRIRDLVADASPPLSAVVLDADAMSDIDYTGLQGLRDLVADLERHGVTLAIARASHLVHRDLRVGAVLQQTGTDHIFASVEEAVTALAPGA